MRERILGALPALATCAALAAPAGAQVVIDFDDLTGMTGGGAGTPVAPAHLVTDQYLDMGVRFDSLGGGVAIKMSTGSSLSSPNIAIPTEAGPVISWTAWVDATFWVGGKPALVDTASVQLTPSSSTNTLEAFDLDGASLGSAHGGVFSPVSVTFPGKIHRVRIHEGYYAFDDFVFDGLAPSGPMSGDIDSASLAAGATQTLSLDFDEVHASQLFLVLGSLSGTSPGYPIDDVVIPLNFDLYMLATLNAPGTTPLVGSPGLLDAMGDAFVSVVVPPGAPMALAGFELNHAAVLLDIVQPNGILEVSDAVPLALVP